MPDLSFIKPDRLWLRDHPSLREKWVQQRLQEDPGLLGLGDLVVKDVERIQARAGRLDLLLQDAESTQRYEVELQLGATDESHIIRTIEYWDIERKRYPQYEHCAVIVAEDITSRFLNIIGLFNGTIPLIALQMSALRFGGQISLVFTRVMDVLERGTDEEDEQGASVDRSYWEERATRETVALADEFLHLLSDFAPGLVLKYNKFYIGLTDDGQPNNFVQFRPKKASFRAEFHLPQSDETQELLDKAGFDVMDYDQRWKRYRVRLTAKDMAKQRDLLIKLARMARDQHRS